MIRMRQNELWMRKDGLDSQWEESTRELSGMEAAGKVIEDAEEAAGSHSYP